MVRRLAEAQLLPVATSTKLHVAKTRGVHQPDYLAALMLLVHGAATVDAGAMALSGHA